MREIARIYDKDATKLNHNETALIIQRELDNGRDVAVIYILCEDAGQNES